MTTPDTTVSYVSNSAGLRQSRTEGGSTDDFVWSTVASVPLLLSDGESCYVYGPSSAPIAQVSSTGDVEYLFGDLIGSTRVIADDDGDVVATSEYDTFGVRVAHAGSADSRFGYSGNWTDPDTGLVYLRARDYDPATAQFLTVDPALDLTHQPYAYVANNPLLLTDPLGLYSCDDYGKNALAFTFGLIDGLTFGASSLILGMAVPGYNEFTENNGWFIGGMVVGSIAPALVTAGGSLAISAVSLGSRVLVRGATHAVVSGTEHLAASATRNTLMQTLEHAAGSGARESLEAGTRTTARETAETAAQSCFVNSFTADTPVVMADGSTKRIADVQLGDLVVATDPETGETAARPVTALIRHSGDHEMADVELSDGTVIHATAEHPFWDASTAAFTYARDLAIGDRVLALDGSELTVTAVARHGEDVTAFNLQIDGIHTYYAGETPVLVHNSCDLDAEGIAHAISNHTASGAGYAKKLASGKSPGIWDDGVDLHGLAHMSDGLKGVVQTGRHSSELFIIDAGKMIGTAGNGMTTSTFYLMRDRWSGALINMFPVAP